MGIFEKSKRNLLVVILRPIAIVLLVNILRGVKANYSVVTVSGDTIEVDYTDCKADLPIEVKCATEVENNKKCYCYIPIHVDVLLKPPLTLYYELPNFNQSRTDYARSRDDAQLAGNLTSDVSENCGNYSKNNGKVIAPCGEIADSMFQDQFKLIDANNTQVPYIDTGLNLVTENGRNKYRNPPAENLNIAFQNFSKPKSWPSNVTDTLKSDDENNNGFQNERFIAWMNTDLKKKPAWRINHTGVYEEGLPAGDYELKINYYRSQYITGPRKVFITSRTIFSDPVTTPSPRLDYHSERPNFSPSTRPTALYKIGMMIIIISILLA